MGLFSGHKKTNLPWKTLSEVSQLAEIDELSQNQPVLIYKHSTRCSISSMAKNRLELYWDTETGIVPYYLDLLSYRPVSDEIARRYEVVHESPQVLLIRNGKCLYSASHNEIDFNQIKKQV